MNVQAGGWRTADSDNHLTAGLCTDVKVNISLVYKSTVDSLVFAKLKPVKIVKSLGINYGNKALENMGATFKNKFDDGI